MYIGRVIGNVVSVAKIEQLESARLFIVEHFDFRLADDSPAFALGFRKIDMSDVGPRR